MKKVAKGLWVREHGEDMEFWSWGEIRDMITCGDDNRRIAEVNMSGILSNELDQELNKLRQL